MFSDKDMEIKLTEIRNINLDSDWPQLKCKNKLRDDQNSPEREDID